MTCDARPDPFEVRVSMDAPPSGWALGNVADLAVGHEAVLAAEQVEDLFG